MKGIFYDTMKSLTELGVSKDDWKSIRSAHEELFNRKTIRNNNRDDLPVSPSEEETIQLLKACARRLGFEYIPE